MERHGKPPLLPPRNWLASGAIVGKKPPLTFHARLARRREQERWERQNSGMRSVALGVGNGRHGGLLLPLDRREAARKSLTGADPNAARSQRNLEPAIQRTRQRARHEAAVEVDDAAYLASFSGAGAGEISSEPLRSVRPPRPEPGRYSRLKDG